MNLLLSDDYMLQDYPESITNKLHSGHATMLRFNRKGDYLASGRVDGKVIIWSVSLDQRRCRSSLWCPGIGDLRVPR